MKTINYTFASVNDMISHRKYTFDDLVNVNAKQHI